MLLALAPVYAARDGPPGPRWMYGRHRLAPTATSILMQSGGGRILKTGAAPRGLRVMESAPLGIPFGTHPATASQVLLHRYQPN